MCKKIFPMLFVCVACGMASAQESNPTATQKWPQPQQQPQGTTREGVPVYKVTVVGRDIPAINYFHRSGSTKIGFEGTSLLPQAKGSATVESGRGRITIHAKFEGLIPANSFAIEYLTYVLWAITPEGRPVNLGEVLPQGSKNEITVTTNLQAFGLIVTAEPYFAVTMPSDLVVIQNSILHDKTQGILETVNAHYSLLPRGAYTQTAGRHSIARPITRNERSPLELYEAINAVQIAEAAGADKYAADTLATAKQNLQNAQELDSSKKGDKKQVITYARGSVQSAEDARIITIRKMRAEEEANNKQQAQQAALAAQQASAQQAQAEAERERAQAAAERARAEQLTAQQQAQQANQQTEQMREKLRAQLNQVLATQETARGLIVNMSDVLFDFNKFTLKQDTQIKLARVAGILLTYPDLKLQSEGYTDNIGSDEYNQKLSQQRAGAVRDFLLSQGVQSGNIASTGYGKGNPIADNSTNAGRAQNRRVQLVVSGNAIGVQEQAPSAQTQPIQQPQAQPPARQFNSGVSNVPPQ